MGLSAELVWLNMTPSKRCKRPATAAASPWAMAGRDQPWRDRP